MTTFPSIRRVIVRVPNWIGDVVHALPALAALRTHFASAEITAIARGDAGDLLVHHPSVDRVISYPASRGAGSLRSVWNAAGRLRGDGYDLGIVLTNAFEGAWLFFLAGIPRRYGYATDGRGWLLTHGQPCSPEIRRLHQADYYLALLSGLGIAATRGRPRLEPTGAERLGAAERLRSAGWAEGQSLIALCPGAGFGEAKRWPVERYEALALRLVRDDGRMVVVLGGPAERPMGQRLASGAGVIDLAGRTSLREALAVLSWCDLAVSNDSGLLHVAAAAGRPVVALFGSTNPDRTGPTGPRVRIVRRPVSCSPCELRSCPIDHRCMTWIDVDEVRDAVAALLTAPAERTAQGSAAVFLDRDGTLNRDVGYLSDPDRLELLPGVEPAVRALNDAGFRVVVVTNQSGVARGLITAPQLDAIHRRLTERLRAAGAAIDEILCCPHHPEAQCACRKPEPALVAEAQARLAIDLARSFVVGDKLADVRLARRVGAKGVLVRTGHGQLTLEHWPEGEPPPDHVADDLPNAVRWILQTAAVPA